MLDIREIEYWISRYEQEADNLDQCVTLSALYSIRDKMIGTSAPQPQIAAYSEAAAPVYEIVDRYGDSEFLRAVEGLDPALAWSVMDEHMKALRVFSPRVYEGVIRKLQSV